MLRPADVDSQVYRSLVRSKGLVSTRLLVKQTDMLISAQRDMRREALDAILSYRMQLEGYIAGHPDFVRTLAPLEDDEQAPPIVRAMIAASARAGVGPMATVAGAMADFVGHDLLAASPEVIVENGGDIMLRVNSRREMLVLAETSPFRGLRIAVGPTPEPIGICTSSGTLGPSLSFGRADAVTIIAETAAMADAAATAVGNLVTDGDRVQAGLDKAMELDVDGVLILVEDRIGAWGRIDIIE